MFINFAICLQHNMDFGEDDFEAVMLKYPVIHIPFNDLMQPCHSYDDYIGRIEKQLLADLKAAYPDVNMKGKHLLPQPC
ncbi:hypothetical protein [Faecalicatena orotica]|uniref:hypothetical protein n=1 Tax=Clostridia TaxID=186801 RepID=UPI002ED15DD8